MIPPPILPQFAPHLAISLKSSSAEAPANEIRVAATQSLSTIIERALVAFKAHDQIVVRGLGGAISGAVQVGFLRIEATGFRFVILRPFCLIVVV